MARGKRRSEVEYGDLLREYVDELNKQSLFVPSAVQTYLGGVVSGAYQTAFAGYAGRQFPGQDVPLNQLVADGSPYIAPAVAANIRRQVQAKAFNPGFLLNSSFAVGKEQMSFRQALPALAGALENVHTIGDAQNILFRGNLPGFIEAAKSGASGQGQDFAQSISALAAGFEEKLPLYNPAMPNFIKFAQVSAFDAGKNYMRAESEFNRNKGWSLEGSLNSEGDIPGASPIFGNGGEAPISPFYMGGSGAMNVPVGGVSPDVAARMRSLYGGSPSQWVPWTVDPNSPGAQAGVTPDVLARTLGTLGRQDLYNLADHMEAGGMITLSDAGKRFQLQGAYTPAVAREMPGESWEMKLARRMDPWGGTTLNSSGYVSSFSNYVLPRSHAGPMVDPSGFATGNLFPPLATSVPRAEAGAYRRAAITAQDVANYSRAKQMIGPLPADQQGYMDEFGAALGDIQNTLAGGGNIVGTSTNAIRRQAYWNEVGSLESVGYADRDAVRGVELHENDPLFYGSGGSFGLDPSEAAVLSEDSYIRTVGYARTPNIAPVATMREILAGNKDFDPKAVVDPRENELSRGIAATIDPRYNPRDAFATVMARESSMEARMEALKKANPNLYARARYVGKNPGEMQDAVSQVARNYGASIGYVEGHDADFAAEYIELSKTNPEAAQAISALFPTQSEQFEVLGAMEKRARIRSGTPAPVRNVYAETGHRVALPGGGHAQARFPVSGRRVRGGDEPSVDQMLSGSAYDNLPGVTPLPVRAANPTGGGGPPEPPEEPPFDPNMTPPQDEEDPAPQPARNFAGPEDVVHQTPQAMARRRERTARFAQQTRVHRYGTGAIGLADRPYGKLDPEGVRNSFERSGGMVGMSIEGFNSTVFGHGIVTRDADDNVLSERVVTEGGEISLDTADVRKARTTAQGIIHKGLSSPLPSDPVDAQATFSQRAFSGTKKAVDEFVKNLENSGTSPIDAAEVGKAFGSVVKTFVDSASRVASVAIERQSREETGLGATREAVREAKMTAVKLTSADAVSQVAATNPEFKRAIETAGLTLDRAASLDAGEEMVISGEGYSYAVGGGGRGVGGGGFAQRMSGGMGRVGQIAYGAYMMNQLWKMGTGGIMQETEAYGRSLSGVGSLALYGSDVPVAATEAGYAARQAATSEYIGRTNYQNFGGFMDLGYYATGGGDAAGRMYSSARMGIGIAGAGLAAPALFGGMAAMSPALAGLGALAASPVLPIAGAAIGAGMIAGTLGMEAWNQAHPDSAPITWGSIPEAVVRSSSINSARERYMQKNNLMSEAQYNRAGAYAKAYGANLSGKQAIDPNSITNEQLMGVMTTRELAGSGMASMGPEVERIMATAAAITEGTGESNEEVLGALKSIQRRTGQIPDRDQAVKLAMAMQRAGRTSLQGASEGDRYASGFGYIAGSEGYSSAFNSYWESNLTEADRDRMMQQSQRSSGLASQISGYFDDPYSGGNIVRATGMSNNVQASSAQRLLSSWSGVFGAPNQGRGQFLSDIGMNTTPFNAGMISDFIQTAGSFGMDSGQTGYMASQMASFNPQQTRYAQAAINGDLQGLSYMSRQMGIGGNEFYDASGRSTFQVNGAAHIAALNNWAGVTGMSQTSAGQMLGTSNQSIIDAFNQNGMGGLEALGRQYSYEASMASSGVALKGIQLQEQFYWGGGSYKSPGEGSMWWMEDQQRAAQNTSQLADFAVQGRRMQMSNQFQIQREGIEGNRMQMSQSYNLWQTDFGRSQSLMQRGWAQADWQYQDTQRGLQNNWNMEDINEQIRFSTGRQRRTLMRQKERMVTSENLESEQIDENRDRQKQSWALEDERYKKNREYQVEMAKLDRQSYDLNKKQREEFFALDEEEFERKKKEYEENFKLQTEMQELQRKYQYDQLQLSKESAGISAWAAQKQKELNDAMIAATKEEEKRVGAIEQMNKYDKVPVIMQAINDMLAASGKASPSTISAINNLMITIGAIDITSVQQIKEVLETVAP